MYPGLKGDYWVNKHEIKIKLSYAVSGNPFEMIDPVLDAVLEFDTREFKEKVEQITRIKALVMQWAAYLERVLSKKAYAKFVRSLLPRDK